MRIEQAKQVLSETMAARERAVRLLEGLKAAHAACERQIDRIKHPDRLKSVTGRSVMENAIESTQRMIASLDRTIHETREELRKAESRMFQTATPVLQA